MKTYYVYILKCNDSSYYVGMTNDLDRRIEDHNFGRNVECYTYKRRPFTVVHSEYFYDVNQAISREKQIKGWTRKKKEALISENVDLLVELANHNNKVLRQAQDDKAKTMSL